jgi:hypothetical protein
LASSAAAAASSFASSTAAGCSVGATCSTGAGAGSSLLQAERAKAIMAATRRESFILFSFFDLGEDSSCPAFRR